MTRAPSGLPIVEPRRGSQHHDETTGSRLRPGRLFAINAINFFDRQIGGVLAEPIRKEWGLTDIQVGWLATAFTLLYAAMGLPLGRLADRANRPRILAAGVCFWSAMTAASSLTRNFGQFFLVRLGVGIGEATAPRLRPRSSATSTRRGSGPGRCPSS